MNWFTRKILKKPVGTDPPETTVQESILCGQKICVQLFPRDGSIEAGERAASHWMERMRACDAITSPDPDFLCKIGYGIERLWHSWPPDMREAVLLLVMKTGHPESAGLLLKALGDGLPGIRLLAAEALAKLGDGRWQQAVLGKNGDWERMVEIDREQAVSPLITALCHHDEDERRQTRVAIEACRLLGLVGGDEAVKWLVTTIECGLRRFDYKDGGLSIAPLPVRLDERVREAAAKALGRTGDPRTFWPLTQAMSNPLFGVETYRVRVAAAEALGAVGNKLAIPSLIHSLMAGHPPLRLSAARALAALGQTQWLEWVRGDEDDFARLVRSGHPDTRKAAFLVVATKPFNYYDGYYEPVHRKREDLNAFEAAVQSLARAPDQSALMSALDTQRNLYPGNLYPRVGK
jgi:HEAT repeat protein